MNRLQCIIIIYRYLSLCNPASLLVDLSIPLPLSTLMPRMMSAFTLPLGIMLLHELDALVFAAIMRQESVYGDNSRNLQ